MRLSLNCTVDYHANFLSQVEADALYHELIDNYKIDQARLSIVAGGRLIETDSFKILFASQRLIDCRSHPESIHGKSYAWSGAIADLREKVETLTGKAFELAMALYYPDGNFFAPYHQDQETAGSETVIPSLSLGEVREFSFRENETDKVTSLDLAHGSLLVMGKHAQSKYYHSLPKNPKYKGGRINITFRDASFK